MDTYYHVRTATGIKSVTEPVDVSVPHITVERTVGTLCTWYRLLFVHVSIGIQEIGSIQHLNDSPKSIRDKMVETMHSLEADILDHWKEYYLYKITEVMKWTTK